MKYIAVPGLILTTLATSLLLGLDGSHWTDSGSFYQSVNNNRATSQLFVQVISQCLGALQVRILCSLINLSTRLRLSRRPVDLDLLKFWNAVCGVRLDWSLPTRTLAPLIAFLLASLVPGAIWAGALTPVATFTSTASTHSGFRTSSPSIRVPRYGQKSKLHWGYVSLERGGLSWEIEKGVFTYTPNFELQGIILDQAATASSRNSSTPTHAKLDYSQYAYEGRSFGVGSSVGLVDSTVGSLGPLGYNYTEVGYQSEVHCIKNDTLNWSISDVVVEPTNREIYPEIYLVNGTLSNGAEVNYTACGIMGPSNTAALAGQALNGENISAFAAGRYYGRLNKTQGTVDFKPTNFSVAVNITTRTITVTPLSGQTVSQTWSPPEK